MEDIYFKQTKMYDPNTEKQPKITIIGAGSIGSHTCISLTKTGLKNITIIDYDEVETSNIPAQFYDEYSSIKREQKTEAIKRLTKAMTGTEISTIQEKIESTRNLEEPELNEIIISALDNNETRKILLEFYNGRPVWLIDGRIGGYQYEIYTIRMNDTEQVNKYAKTLEGEFENTECGMKTLWSVNSSIAAEITMNTLNIIKGEPKNWKIIRNMQSGIQIRGEQK